MDRTGQLGFWYRSIDICRILLWKAKYSAGLLQGGWCTQRARGEDVRLFCGVVSRECCQLHTPPGKWRIWMPGCGPSGVLSTPSISRVNTSHPPSRTWKFQLRCNFSLIHPPRFSSQQRWRTNGRDINQCSPDKRVATTEEAMQTDQRQKLIEEVLTHSQHPRSLQSLRSVRSPRDLRHLWPH